MLKLAPNDPEARRLSTDLDRYAKKQADDALAKVKDARSRAQQARPELAQDAFEAAKRLDAEGQRLFDSKQFSQAAARLGEASDAYGRAETEARSEAERQRVENERLKAAEAERQRAAALAAQKPTPSPTAVVDEAAQRQAEEARRARQDRQAVEALLQRYKASVEARDFEALKATWPSAPEKQLRQGFQLARSWRLDLQPTDIQIVRRLRDRDLLAAGRDGEHRGDEDSAQDQHREIQLAQEGGFLDHREHSIGQRVVGHGRRRRVDVRGGKEGSQC